MTKMRPAPAASQITPLSFRHGMANRHAQPQALRGARRDIARNTNPGLFGRMFPGLPPLKASDKALEALAAAMKDPAANPASGDNLKIPAGYTYLGQFVDHDITLDLTSLSERVSDPLAVENFRTPGLDLDSVYGLGPGPDVELYERSGTPPFGLTGKLLVGTASASPDQNGAVIASMPNDLERGRHGFALIGDHRNDENLLVAQTHLAFIKFHNKVVDHLAATGVPAAERFDRARQLVRWHYQWIVLHDWVARLCEKGTVGRVLHEGRKFYRFRTRPYMPVEFSAALYRLGHSMVRELYDHNRVFRTGGLAPGSLDLLFRFTGLSGQLIGTAAAAGVPLPQPVLPSNWVIDWRRFFDFNTPPDPATGMALNHSRQLDPFITEQLHTLPGFPAGTQANLAFRNLKRGVNLGLPSGQAVAAAMRRKLAFTPLTPDEIASGPDGAVAKAHKLHTATPLWYYVLKEAQVRGRGEHLGPVGSRLLAEVFVGLVQGDSESFLAQKKAWKPTLPSRKAGSFEMVDLLQFVGDISPIDGVTTVNTL